MLLVLLRLSCRLATVAHELVAILQLLVVHDELGEAFSWRLLLAVALLNVCRRILYITRLLAHLVLLLLTEVAGTHHGSIFGLDLRVRAGPPTLLTVMAVLLESCLLINDLLPLVVLDVHLLLLGR